MHARSTTVHGRPDAIDAGIAHMRDKVMPALMDIDGWIGLSLLVDRNTGRCIATAAWDNEDAMRSAEQPVESIRRQAAEQFGGSVEKVERWEIAVLHRDHRAGDGACMRCTWLQLNDVERSLDAYRTQVLPVAEQMDGFCSASFFVDRRSGRAVSGIAFDTQDAMQRSRDEASELRNRVTRDIGAEILEVAEFELAIHHLRVPELV